MRTIIKISILIFSIILSACTTIKVEPDESLRSQQLAYVTLTDKQRIKSQGFELRNREVHLRENKQSLVIPVSDVHQIELVDRRQFALKAFKVGAVTGGILGAYEIAKAGAFEQGLTILAYPVIIVGFGAYAGAAAYVVGHRTYYELNPLDIGRQTEYSTRLLTLKDKNPSSEKAWGGYHFGLNIGPGVANFPRISNFSTSVAQNSKTELFSGRLAIGKWINPKTILSGSITTSNALDGNANYSANRGTFTFGPQITYFPRRYGMFYRGTFNYVIYFETIEDISVIDSDGMGKVIYDKSYNGLGLNGALGYSITLSGRINLSAELSSELYYVENRKTISTASVIVGLHWF